MKQDKRKMSEKWTEFVEIKIKAANQKLYELAIDGDLKEYIPQVCPKCLELYDLSDKHGCSG